LISFGPIDTAEQNFLPVGAPVEDTRLVDVRGEASLQLAPLNWVLREAAVLEIIEEGLKPIILFNSICSDNIDFTFLWDEL